MRSSGGVRGAARAPTTGVAREARTTAPEAAVRGAGLTPAAVLQLQRTVGNRAVGRLLQREKSEEERGTKHSRVTRVREALPTLAGKLKGPLKEHLFNAKPFVGAVNKDAPQGLHAYTGGALPADIRQSSVVGSTGRVHSLTWNYDGHADKTKTSTMFPTWMTADHVAALLVARYPNDNKISDGVNLADLNVSKSEVNTYVQRGQEITLEKSGDTVYPTL